jgi:hypothetical protein
LGSPRPPAALVLTDVARGESSRIAPKVPESWAPGPSTPGLPTFHRVLPGFSPGTGSVRVTAPVPVPSLSRGFLPYSDRDCKGAVFPGVSRIPAPCVFRLRTSLDALLPFAASDPFESGRSWDSPFRALLLPARRWVLSDHRTLLTLLVPNAATLAMCAVGSGSLRGS